MRLSATIALLLLCACGAREEKAAPAAPPNAPAAPAEIQPPPAQPPQSPPAPAPLPRTLVKELHAVGVYEGHNFAMSAHLTCAQQCMPIKYAKPFSECMAKCPPRPAWPGPPSSNVIPVTVDRPGADVALVLGAYDAINWKVTARAGTKISTVALIGYGAEKASVEVNGSPPDKLLVEKEVEATYDTEGEGFRFLVEALSPKLGFEKLDSFQGNYHAPAGGYFINDVDAGLPQLAPDYLRLRRIALPASETLRIETEIGGKAGIFRPDGSLVEERKRTSYPGLAASDAAVFRWYRRDDIIEMTSPDDVYLKRLPTPEEQSIKVGNFAAMTYDSSAERLIAVFQSGGAAGDIMAFTLSTGQWTKLASTGRNHPASVFHDVAGKRLLVAGGDFSKTAFIAELDANGGFRLLQTIRWEKLPGMGDLFDPENEMLPNVLVLGADGDRVVLGADGLTLFDGASAHGPLRRVWVVNTKTGAVDLTYYDR